MESMLILRQSTAFFMKEKPISTLGSFCDFFLDAYPHESCFPLSTFFLTLVLRDQIPYVKAKEPLFFKLRAWSLYLSDTVVRTESSEPRRGRVFFFFLS